MRVTQPDLSRRGAVLHGSGALLALLGVGASAEEGAYPSRPIRLVPFGTTGGPIDIIARSYGDASSSASANR
jgi:tripartite-type tricarboxylate transporter receptor subunit TctC